MLNKASLLIVTETALPHASHGNALSALSGSAPINFSDMNAKSLIDEWILDAADLETISQETQLQFSKI
jgi:hypothetical protein